MITRFVRFQLVAFAILTLAATLMIILVYLRVPTLLGVGQIQVTADFPSTGGLYPNANVTYRGYTVGKVKKIDLIPTGVRATLSIDKGKAPPRDSRAEVHSVSAIGEQYVDFVPTANPGPPIRHGDRIDMQQTSTPPPIASVLDSVDDLVTSLNPRSLTTVLDEAAAAFDGLGPDLGRLADNTRALLDAADANYEPTRQLIQNAPALLDAIRQSDPSIRQWADDLSSFTGTLAKDDPQIRAMLANVPPAAGRAGDLLQQLSLTTPTLLGSTDVLAKLAKAYNAPIEQILVVYPLLTVENLTTAPEYLSPGVFKFNLETDVNPPSCMDGWVPEGQPGGPRPSNVLSDEELPANSYCKLPQNDPRVTRGARNLQCFEPGSPPGRRAGTIQACRGDGEKPITGKGVFVPGETGLGGITILEGPLTVLGAVGSPPPQQRELTWQGLLIAPAER
ncbi:MCE family protein [Protofrankia coriariae]|uniref:MCE family protein n=1 Tax=Protofrankia coriariae TaxID=1562887 RepID=UPI000699BF14|nr:MlaD family protein [Protofrankia coriariae]